MKSYLLIMQQNPYANSLALEGLEFALGISSFNQNVALLFKGAGVLQLLAKQEPDKLVAKDFTKIYSGLDLFGIKNIYVEQNSLYEFAANELQIQPQIVDAVQIAALIKTYDIIVTI